MTNERTYYEILQVASDASPEIITSAYRTLMSTLKMHPDLGGNADEAVLINEAYEILSDDKKRRVYDSWISGKPRKTTQPTKINFDERRRAARHLLDATVSYCLDYDLNWHTARVKDVSVLGVKLQSSAPLTKGQHLVIVPPNLAATAIHGTVRWSREFHPSVFERIYEAGIEFSDQISDVEKRLTV